MGFADRGIEPPDGFAGDGFDVRPLLPTDVVLDHDAVMASRDPSRLDSPTLVYFAVVDGEHLRPFSCRFRFHVDAQRYAAEAVAAEDRLDVRIYPPESDAWDRFPSTPGD